MLLNNRPCQSGKLLQLSRPHYLEMNILPNHKVSATPSAQIEIYSGEEIKGAIKSNEKMRDYSMHIT